MSEKMYLSRSLDKSILERADCGGAITSILKYVLEEGVVDGVVTVRARAGDMYSGVPVLIAEPKDLIGTAGSLHCSTPNIPRFVKEYLDGASSMKLAVVGKPCDVRAIIELQKRKQISSDNVILIGVNCTGTLSPTTAKQMFVQEFGVDPNEVERVDIDDGSLITFLKDGSAKSKDLLELEEKGFGRRENCRRCEINIPVFADLACGKWGTEGEDEKATFIEVCSEKGMTLVDGAAKGGFIEVVQPEKGSIQVREQKDKTEIERATGWRKRDFEPLLALNPLERLKYWISEFDKCIKCYGCRDACPICYCESCLLEANRGFVQGGEIPPEASFPITRLAHVADSCVNCGQCQDACPMELPLSKLFSLLNSNLCSVFEYTPGLDVEQGPPMITARIEELQMDDTFLDIPSMNRMLQGKS